MIVFFSDEENLKIFSSTEAGILDSLEEKLQRRHFLEAVDVVDDTIFGQRGT